MILWLKALHLIAMVCWFAALFYLPRLFVYHAMSDDKVSIDRFKVMERKLFYGIMSPSAGATILFGGWMTYLNWAYLKTAGWFHAKLFFIVLLIIYHETCKHILKSFAEDKNTRSHVFYRWFNEIPVLFLIAIVILVVVKPF